MRKIITPEFVAENWEKRFPGQIPERLVAAEEVGSDGFELEGDKLAPSRSARRTPTTRPVCLCHRSALSWREMLPTTAHIRFLPSPIMLDGLIRVLQSLPHLARRSVTFDRGTEFTDWPYLQANIGTQTWFCDPQSPGRKEPSRTPTDGCGNGFPERSIHCPSATKISSRSATN